MDALNGTASPATMQEALERIRSLTPAQRAELEQAVLADPAKALWVPNPGPQRLAYASQAFEIFYGGAAGGGKTGLIIGLALTAHQRTLVIRRESTQLRGFIDDIARILKLPDRKGLNRQDGQWRIPPEVAVHSNQLIEFGGVPDPGSEEKHQGVPHDLLAFDEVTQLSEYIIDYLSTWCRSIDAAQRCRMVLTSNPPTPSTMTTGRGQATGGGLWLIRRYAPWLDPQYKDPHGLGQAAPGELRYYVTIEGTELEWPDPFPFYYTPSAHARTQAATQAPSDYDDHRELIVPRSRTFVPARVRDNPYLAQTDYEHQLQKLPEPLRSAMLYGDFSVSLSDRPLQVIPTEWLRAAHRRWEASRNAHPHPSTQPMTATSCDVSRGGGDKTIQMDRHGTWFSEPANIPSAQTLNGASVAARIIERRRDNAKIIIDANGVGASVYDHIRNNTRLADDGALTGYVGSVSSQLRDRSGVYGFTNKRSEIYWLLREALDPATTTQLAIPPDDDLTQELLALTWTEQSGKIKVMPKEEVTKMLGRSTDKADCLAMLWSVFDEASEQARTAMSARERRLADARGLADHYQAYGSYDGYDGYKNGSWRRPTWSDRAYELPYARW